MCDRLGAHLGEAWYLQRQQDPAIQSPAIVLLGEEGLHGGPPVRLLGQQAEGGGIQIGAAIRQGVVKPVLLPLVASLLKDGKLVPNVEKVVPAQVVRSVQHTLLNQVLFCSSN